MRRAATFALAIAGVGAAVLFTAPDKAPRIGADGFPTDWKTAAVGAAGPASATAPATLAAPALPPPAKAAATGTSRVFSPNQPLLAADAQTPPAAQAVDTSQPAPASRRLASSRPADEDARRELVRDLQAELKRVGCYDGEVSGVWSPASKRAMTEFVERVNATLPLDEPDFILLTLVQGHNGKACGQSCPNGQGLGAGGKCVPRAVLAHSAARRDTSPTAQESEPAPIVPPKPKLAARPAAKVGSSWSTVVTPAPAPRTAEPKVAEPALQPAPALPGRMAVGAPIPAEPARAESEAAVVDLAKRKAELAAQTNVGSTSARKVRSTEAQDRASRLKAAQKSAALAPAVTPPPATAPAPASKLDQAKASATRKPVRLEAAEAQRRMPVPMAVPGQVIVTLPPPARAPQPRIVQVYPAVRPAATPSYTPQPMRWSRSIFNDVERMR